MSRLPFRTSGEDLKQVLEASARGRSPDQIESIFGGGRTFNATAFTAAELGFIDDPDTINLTDQGRRFARGDKDEQAEILLKALLSYDAYDLLLESMLGQGTPETTPTEKFETWWGTASEEYGSSQTNLSEGSTAFANLLEFAGLGKYIQGRKGHPSRVEWNSDAGERVAKARKDLLASETQPVEEEQANPIEEDGRDDTSHHSHSEKEGRTQDTKKGNGVSRSQEEHSSHASGEVENNLSGSAPPPHLSKNNVTNLKLDGGREVWISTPSKMTKEEVERVHGMLDHMVLIDEEADQTGAEDEEKKDDSQHDLFSDQASA